jgi:hypothetical protein
MNKALTYGATLIGLYLVVFYASGSGTVIKSGARGGTDIIKAFQGR